MGRNGQSMRDPVTYNLRDRPACQFIIRKKLEAEWEICNQGAAGGAATATTNNNMATHEVGTDGNQVVEVELHHHFSYISTPRYGVIWFTFPLWGAQHRWR